MIPNGWISVDQGWIKSGYIQGDVLEPFPGSGMAIWGRHRASKWLKMAINGPFVAISRFSGQKPTLVSPQEFVQLHDQHKNVVFLVSRHDGSKKMEDVHKK